MPYFEQDQITLTGAAFADYSYQLTSIFDPNTTGTGHQPRGRDTWALLYGYYRVRKVFGNVIASIVGVTDTSAGPAQLVGTALSVYSGGGNSVENIIEDPSAAGYLFNQWGVLARTGNSATNANYARSFSFDLEATRPYLFNSAAGAEQFDLNTAFGASPSGFNQYFTIYSGSQSGVDNVDVQFTIQLNYVVEMLDPLPQGAS